MTKFYILNGNGDMEFLGEFKNSSEALDTTQAQDSFFVANEATAREWLEQLKTLLGE